MPLEPLLSTMHDDPEAQELITEYVDGLTGQCEALREAVRTGDAETVKLIAHRLRGSGGGYGFPTITEAAGRLEDAVVGSETIDEHGRARTNELVRVCQRATAALTGEQRESISSSNRKNA